MIFSSDIYRGVLTGYNQAFVIDDKVRLTLLDQDPKSAEIIKPVLRGRDIQRYQAQWAGLWIIATFPSLHLDINDYPAVKKYLLSYDKERLEQVGKTLSDGSKSRKRTPHHWFELQDTCAYHDEFSKEKLFWMDLTERGRFAYEKGTVICLNTAYMVTGCALKFLCAVLNSDLISWYIRNSALNSGMGVPRWVRFTVERVPVPRLAAEEQDPFIQLVDRVLLEMTTKLKADIRELEDELNKNVYKLYELTPKEIQSVVNGAT